MNKSWGILIRFNSREYRRILILRVCVWKSKYKRNPIEVVFLLSKTWILIGSLSFSRSWKTLRKLQGKWVESLQKLLKSDNNKKKIRIFSIQRLRYIDSIFVNNTCSSNVNLQRIFLLSTDSDLSSGKDTRLIGFFCLLERNSLWKICECSAEKNQNWSRRKSKKWEWKQFCFDVWILINELICWCVMVDDSLEHLGLWSS